MKGLSVLFILQGLSFFIQSLVNVLGDKNGKFVTMNFDPKLYIIGIFLGILFVLSGVGIGLRKRFAYYLSIGLCALMSLYVLLGAVLIFFQNHYGLLVLMAMILLMYLAIARAILKRKAFFDTI